MGPIRVALADDHALVRAGLRSLIDSMDGIGVVAEAGDGRAAVALAAEYRPDILLMDIAMAGLNGLEAAGRIAKLYPECRIILLSMHSSAEYVIKAIQIGVKGYVLKDAAVSELEVALRAVHRGEKYLSPQVSSLLIDQYEVLFPGNPGMSDLLTPREREVLQLIAEGHTTKGISSILKVSVKTIDTHRTHLMNRLNIHDVAGLVRFAIRTGLASSDK
ncbi:MAG TPA: response regulator transcription factor [Spirochaetia bacterium]|nr:response regulator transcription factor [Spirochaetia bacterium]